MRRYTLSDFPRLPLGDEFVGPDSVTYMKVSRTHYAPVVEDAPIPLGGKLTALATAARYCSDKSKWIEYQP